MLSHPPACQKYFWQERGFEELIAMRKNVKPFSGKQRKRMAKNQRRVAERMRLAASGRTGACAGDAERASVAGIMSLGPSSNRQLSRWS